MTTHAHLHAIASTTGRRRSFLAENHEAADLMARTTAEGIDNYFDADAPAWALAVPAAQQSLLRANLDIADIDLIVYCTESTDSRSAISRDPNKLAQALGGSHTPLVGVTGNVCANAGAALSVARNAIICGEAENVLVVTADAWDDRPRLVDAGTCLMSDAAAAAIVSTARPSHHVSWEIAAVHPAVDHDMHDVDPAVDTMEMVRGTVAGMQRATARRAAVVGGQMVDHVVSGNLGDTVIKMFARLVGIDHEQIYRLTADNGHCLAADVLINLDHFEARMGNDDRVLVLATGHNYWTCVDLTTRRAAG